MGFTVNSYLLEYEGSKAILVPLIEDYASILEDFKGIDGLKITLADANISMTDEILHALLPPSTTETSQEEE